VTTQLQLINIISIIIITIKPVAIQPCFYVNKAGFSVSGATALYTFEVCHHIFLLRDTYSNTFYCFHPACMKNTAYNHSIFLITSNNT